MKEKELEQLCSTGKALLVAGRVEGSNTEAKRKLLETYTCWGDLLKALNDRKESLLAKQKEADHYSNLLNQFSGWMDGVEKKLVEPVDFVGDPHKIADKLEQMKVVTTPVACTYITNNTLLNKAHHSMSCANVHMYHLQYEGQICMSRTQ